MVTDDEIADVLRGHYAEQCPKMLIELACAHGGEDNITALCVYVDGESEVSSEAE